MDIAIQNWTKRLAVAGTIWVLLLVCVIAQTPTLLERVRAGDGQTLVMPILTDVVPVSIEELSAGADVILDATLVRDASYVSEDGTRVLTDYQIIPNRVFFSRMHDVSPVPGARPPLTLTIVGGEVTIEGTCVKMTNTNLKPVENRGRFLIFGKRDKSQANRFFLSRDSAAIFEVSKDQRLRPLLKQLDSNPQLEGVSFQEIQERIETAVSRK